MIKVFAKDIPLYFKPIPFPNQSQNPNSVKRVDILVTMQTSKKRSLAEDYGGIVGEDIIEYLEQDDDEEGVASSDAIRASSNLSQRIQKRLMKLNDVAAAANEGSDSGSNNVNEEVNYFNFSNLSLKPDHASRPIWVCPNGRIFLEAFSPIYKQAYDFLVAISEPVSRPEFVHEYKLTPYSLYAAVSVSIETESILKVLERLSKNPIPACISTFIRDCTLSYGKAKLVLYLNEFYIESLYPQVLRKLLTNGDIRMARMKEPLLNNTSTTTTADAEFIASSVSAEDQANLQYQQLLNEDYSATDTNAPALLEGDATKIQTVSFKIRKSNVEQVKRACIDMDYPLMEEYDFRNDHSIADLPMDLKPSTRIREYQEKSLSKMFGNGRARSVRF